MDNTLILSENVQATQYDEVGWSGFDGEKSARKIDKQRLAMEADQKWNPVFTWLAIDTAEKPLPFGARINQGRDLPLPEKPNERAILARPSSFHQGGVNAGFASGKTVFLAETIDYLVYQQLMTPDAAQSEMPNKGYVLTGKDF